MHISGLSLSSGSLCDFKLSTDMALDFRDTNQFHPKGSYILLINE